MQEALYTISNGLYVLSAASGGKFCGSLVDAVSQISVLPNLIMVSCMNTSHTKACIEQSGEFAISVLPKNIDPYVVANFGFQSGRDVDKWANVPYEIKEGLPYIPTALAKIRAKVIDKLVYQNNTVFIAEVENAFDVKEGEPLTYKHYRDEMKEECQQSFVKRHAPKTEKANFKQWTCTLCGYVYDGEIPFEELPDDWRCPLCGVGKEVFELR